MKKFRYLGLAIILLITAMAGTSLAAEYWLQAAAFNKTMPDGQVIPMWGFGQCTDGTFNTCSPPTVPGPELVVPPLDNNLTVHLKNNLSGPFVEPISIIIPGQFTTQVPVWIDPLTGIVTGTGSRPLGDVTSRVRSLTHETTPGATQDYVWNNVKTGTYLYESGTHQQIQIPMGLYGAMRKDAAAGAYTPTATIPNTSYDNQVTLLFSEIDPAINNAATTNNYGPGKAMTSTNDYRPKYFLINGEAFSYSRSPITPTPAATPGERMLIRFLSAGSLDHVPVLHGSHMEILAEDGNLYPFSKQQYSLLLAPGKTFDAIMTPANAGYIRVYDRKLNLTNAAASPGGMLTYLKISAAIQRFLTITNPIIGGKVQATGLPGGIDCGLDCTELYNTGTVLALTAKPDVGYAFTGWSGDLAGLTNPIPLAMNSNKTVTATFAPAAPLTVTSPNGGQSWKRGTTQAITWNYNGDIGPFVKIQLLRGTTVVRTISLKAPVGSNGQGSFNWRIPGLQAAANNYQIRITSTTNGAYTDQSNANFTIVR
jgi:uncharacterized repeat protein (TIGR02543 family)